MNQATTEAHLITVPKRKKKKINYRKSAPLLIMMIPGLIYLLFNNYLPMAGIVIAFKQINFAKGILNSDWVGFDNFEYLFKTSDAYIIMRNTILYNIVFIVLGTILSLVCALLLNEIKNKVLLKTYQNLSPETGFLNRTVLPALGIKETILWYSEAKYWPYIMTLVSFWKGVGYSSIVFFCSVAWH